MVFGVYVHIPYCLQRCTYCDFATYVKGTVLPPEEYVSILEEEIERRQNYFPKMALDTLYFGGGTPSLLTPDLLARVIDKLATCGFPLRDDSEVTLEINPATLTKATIDEYLRLGFNRFSVGAQTFNDALLKSVHRQHSSEDTLQTLRLLQERNLNYSFDLLFALPNQTLAELEFDLQRVGEFLPPHISPYCLTVPEGHPLAKLRLTENVQVEMFELIHGELQRHGYRAYEISNYARPGFESRHNQLYWLDHSYWGLGLSSHSYAHNSITNSGAWGTRFWNPNHIQVYTEQIKALNSLELGLNHHSAEQKEILTTAQSLTDYCMTALRTQEGLDARSLRSKFSDSELDLVTSRLRLLESRGLVYSKSSGGDWQMALSRPGVLLSNQVFAELTFLANEL